LGADLTVRVFKPERTRKKRNVNGEVGKRKCISYREGGENILCV
jgi:hypothetical protein